MKITLGHTPDADDAFMFYGISSGKVSSNSFEIEHVVEDIETLNHKAIRHELVVTAISAHAYAYLKDYVILQSGGSFGINSGPILLSKRKIAIDDKLIIGIPGTLTSAYLLLRLALGKFKEKIIPFSEIPYALEKGEVDAGLIIHEDQIAYDKTKFQKIFDLGDWWFKKTGHLPVPLGINVASKRYLSQQQIKEFNDLFKESILYGLDHFHEALNYAMQYGRGKNDKLIGEFVKMYVNDYTIEMGNIGKKSIENLLLYGHETKLLNFPDLLFQ